MLDVGLFFAEFQLNFCDILHLFEQLLNNY